MMCTICVGCECVSVCVSGCETQLGQGDISL